MCSQCLFGPSIEAQSSIEARSSIEAQELGSKSAKSTTHTPVTPVSQCALYFCMNPLFHFLLLILANALTFFILALNIVRNIRIVLRNALHIIFLSVGQQVQGMWVRSDFCRGRLPRFQLKIWHQKRVNCTTTDFATKQRIMKYLLTKSEIQVNSWWWWWWCHRLWHLPVVSVTNMRYEPNNSRYQYTVSNSSVILCGTITVPWHLLETKLPWIILYFNNKES